MPRSARLLRSRDDNEFLLGFCFAQFGLQYEEYLPFLQMTAFANSAVRFCSAVLCIPLESTTTVLLTADYDNVALSHNDLFLTLHGFDCSVSLNACKHETVKSLKKWMVSAMSFHDQ